jgi:hypothetical protein
MAAHTLMAITPGLLNGRRAYACERDRRRKQVKVLQSLAAAQEKTAGNQADAPANGRRAATARARSGSGGSDSKDGGDGAGASLEPLGSSAAAVGAAASATAAAAAAAAAAARESLPQLLPNCFQILGLDVMLVFDERDGEDSGSDAGGHEGPAGGSADVAPPPRDRRNAATAANGNSRPSGGGGSGAKAAAAAKKCRVRASLLEVNSNPAMSVGHKVRRRNV